MTDATEPTARDDLEVRLIRDAGLSPHWAKRQIDAFAHQLAEKIRRELPDGPAVAGIVLTRSAAEAADLIDPEVER
jgi:hypothetical protein